MPIDRRGLLRRTAALIPAGGALLALSPPTQAGARQRSATTAISPSAGDQTSDLQAAIDAAASSGQPVDLGAGAFHVGPLTLRQGSYLRGIVGATRLILDHGGALLTGNDVRAVRLEGLILDGASAPLDVSRSDAVLSLTRCRDVVLSEVEVVGSLLNGISLRECSGRIERCRVLDCGNTALFCLDSYGLLIADNEIARIGNNGIQIWTSKPGEDGSIVARNRITQVSAQAGGSGENGNGINVFRAGSVLVEGNRISDCAFSAIRANSASNCQMIGNSCERIGEVALYAEFAFAGVIISGNLVSGAAQGVSVTNFNEGGRLAVVEGNLVRDLVRREASEDKRGIGISVEADAAVTGNVVESAATVGILVGWKGWRRDVAVTGNVVRRSAVGIGLSSGPEGGTILASGNLISGAGGGAIRAMAGDAATGPELAAGSGPVEGYSGLSVTGNLVG